MLIKCTWCLGRHRALNCFVDQGHYIWLGTCPNALGVYFRPVSVFAFVTVAAVGRSARVRVWELTVTWFPLAFTAVTVHPEPAKAFSMPSLSILSSPFITAT